MLLTNLYTGIPQGRSMPVCAGQHAGLCKWVDTGLMWFNTLVHEALAKFPLNTVSTKQYLNSSFEFNYKVCTNWDIR